MLPPGDEQLCLRIDFQELRAPLLDEVVGDDDLADFLRDTANLLARLGPSVAKKMMGTV